MNNSIEDDPNIQYLKKQREDFEYLLENQSKSMQSFFSTDLEAKFWQDREDRIIKLIIRAFIPSSIFYLLFEVVSLPINYFTAEEPYRKHDVLLSLISYSTGWVVLFVIYLMARHPVWKKYYRNVLVVVISLGLSVVQVSLFSTQDPSMTWRGTLIIIFALMFSYICSGLRPLYTFFSGMFSAVITCIVLSFSHKFVPQWVLFNVLILGNLVGLGLAVLTISAERIRFLQSIIIDLDKKIYAGLNDYLLQLSHQDTLTLLSNRRSFERQFAQSIFNAKEKHQPLALLFIDVDFFKLFNDCYGHHHGDIALVSVADVLKKNIHEQDFAGRFGGEEFIIMLNDSSPEAAIEVAKNILKDIRHKNIPHEDSKVAEYLTLSIGITVYTGQENVFREKILTVADNALYQAKNQGRDRYIFMPIQ